MAEGNVWVGDPLVTPRWAFVGMKERWTAGCWSLKAWLIAESMARDKYQSEPWVDVSCVPGEGRQYVSLYLEIWFWAQGEVGVKEDAKSWATSKAVACSEFSLTQHSRKPWLVSVFSWEISWLSGHGCTHSPSAGPGWCQRLSPPKEASNCWVLQKSNSSLRFLMCPDWVKQGKCSHDGKLAGCLATWFQLL